MAACRLGVGVGGTPPKCRARAATHGSKGSWPGPGSRPASELAPLHLLEHPLALDVVLLLGAVAGRLERRVELAPLAGGRLLLGLGGVLADELRELLLVHGGLGSGSAGRPRGAPS